MGIAFPSHSRADHSLEGQAEPRASATTLGALTFVAEASPECQIFRDLARGYLVRHPGLMGGMQRVATLACAYSLCQEMAHRAAPATGLD